jgi:hypothetical protein
MMGPAPVVLSLALAFAAAEPAAPRADDDGAALEPTRIAAAMAADVGTTAEPTTTAAPAVSAPATDRNRARERRLRNVSARLGTGLTPRRATDDREQPLIGPVSLLAGFGTIVIDVEVPN